MKAIVTFGMGFGDEGKGGTVDFLCRRHRTSLVVRYSGGCQAGHNVELPNGHRHTFSQWGAGTFAKANTHLAQPVIIDPLAMANESKALRQVCNLEALSLTVHPRCLVSTVLHKVVNRNDAKNVEHGTCGMGIGVTRKYWLDHGDDAIFAEDLRNRPRLCEKLSLFCERHSLHEFSVPAVANELLEYGVPSIYEMWPLYEDFWKNETIIFEGAQGMLLDQRFGLQPHTTWSDVTPRYAFDLAKAWGAEQITVLGVTRTYMTRHGNGPLPTFDFNLRFDDKGNPEHQFQGKMRFGHLDMDLLRYSAANLGTPLDGLAVNCLDHVAGDTLDRLRELAPIKITANGPTWEHRKEL